jgi:cAMP-specific phosphodiesterase 4
MSSLESQLDTIIAEGSSAALAWKNVGSLEFDATTLSDDELYCMSFRLIVIHDLHKEFSITSNMWIKFITTIKDNMKANPYHNFQHIMDVTQTTNVILLDPLLSSKLDLLDKFIVLLSALLHDINHPGMNNAYQISANTELALLYNDISVLESMHACHASKLLLEDNGILQGVTLDTKKKIRKVMIELILGTDMVKHFAISGELSKFNGDKDRNTTLSVEDKTLILKSILHMADISNPAKSWNTSKLWSDRVAAEFFNQGDIERTESLPISPMCDRNATSQDESSLGFCDFIVAPYLYQTTVLAPTVLIPACKTLKENRDVWHNMLADRLKDNEEKIKPWLSKKEAFETKFKALIDSFP